MLLTQHLFLFLFSFLSDLQIYSLLQQNLRQFKNFLFTFYHLYPRCQTFHDDITFVKICISVPETHFLQLI